MTATPIRGTVKACRQAGIDMTGEVVYLGSDPRQPAAVGRRVTIEITYRGPTIVDVETGERFWIGGVASKHWFAPVPAVRG